jgi:aspartate kinase
VVSYGELVSTTIVSHYFNYSGLKNNWIDVRPFIKTDDNYRDALVDWETTQKLFQKGKEENLKHHTRIFRF